MPLPDIRLLVIADCPNAGLARERLSEALSARGLAESQIRVVSLDSPDCPPAFRNQGSPTILIGGEDVAGTAAGAADGLTCRVYPDGGGAPSVDEIARALDRWLEA